LKNQLNPPYEIKDIIHVQAGFFSPRTISAPVYAPQNTVQEVEAAPLQKGVFFFETSFLIQARE